VLPRHRSCDMEEQTQVLDQLVAVPGLRFRHPWASATLLLGSVMARAHWLGEVGPSMSEMLEVSKA
jgi:hypothetical protein